ncbi:MAG: helix-turn-helix domain-containing protein [Actinobacteria bacterium]|nr:helix-turn-helix domain-containing protein [Actinomycetota bacterium]
MVESAGELLRAARQRRGLSQTQLARRANVTQPTISAYESGRREPALATLRRLIEATGCRLDTRIIDPSEHLRPLPDSLVTRRLRDHREQIIATARTHHAHNVRVFGSVARGEAHENSDLDILVDLDAEAGLLDLVALERELAELVRVDVDVVPASGLKDTLREDVMSEAIPL